MTNPRPICGRPKARSGRPCREPVLWNVRDPEAWQPGGCRHHLTDEEKEEKEEIERIRAARLRSDWPSLSSIQNEPVRAAVAIDRERLAREPACWSWPIPEPQSYETEDAARESLYEWQRDRGCAICGPSWPLVDDHDHQTGLVRGRLCKPCNTKEGRGADTPPFEKYRLRNPASILGVEVRYWSAWSDFAEPDLETTEEAGAVRGASDRLSLPTVDEFQVREDVT